MSAVGNLPAATRIKMLHTMCHRKGPKKRKLLKKRKWNDVRLAEVSNLKCHKDKDVTHHVPQEITVEGE